MLGAADVAVSQSQGLCCSPGRAQQRSLGANQFLSPAQAIPFLSPGFHMQSGPSLGAEGHSWDREKRGGTEKCAGGTN